MSYNYQNQQRRQQYGGPMTANSQYSDYNDYSNNYNQNSFNVSDNYSPNSANYNNKFSSPQLYNSMSPTSQTSPQSQSFYNQQQMYQQKQYRVPNSTRQMAMTSNPAVIGGNPNMVYTVNPDASMIYRQKKMQQAAERKYQKLCRLTNRLRDQLRLQTIPVSKAACSLVNYTISVKDPLLPSVWGPIEKRDNPYAQTNNTCACIIM